MRLPVPPPAPARSSLTLTLPTRQIDRCGEQVRYIIDFYNGAPVPGAASSFHIDARPALDSLGAVSSTLYMGFLDAAGALGVRRPGAARERGADAPPPEEAEV